MDSDYDWEYSGGNSGYGEYFDSDDSEDGVLYSNDISYGDYLTTDPFHGVEVDVEVDEGEETASGHGGELEGEEYYSNNEGEEDGDFHVQVEGEAEPDDNGYDGELEVPIEDDEDRVNDLDGVRAGFDYEDESEEEVWRIPPERRRDIDQPSGVRTQAVLLEDSWEAMSYSNNDVDSGSQELRREMNQARLRETMQHVRQNDGSDGAREVDEKGDAGKASSSGDGNGSGGSETDGFSCPICMEPWTTDAEHCVCCLPCGHLYGMSCIMSWLLQPNSKKCPQCNKACSPEDIRRIYGLTFGTMEKELQEKIKLLEAKCVSLELKDAGWKKKETEWRLREALLRLQLKQKLKV